MQIGLIADTHIPEAGGELPPQVFTAFRGVDLVLHAGDMHIPQVLDWLEGVAPVLAVKGNGDVGIGVGEPWLPRDPRVRRVQVLKLEGLTLGMVHDLPMPKEVSWTTWEQCLLGVFGEPVDVAVCGHTHFPVILRHNGVLLVNPGSPTMGGNLRGQLGSVGLLEIVRGRAEARLVPLG
ncbi:MAG: metallophosphoesterase family protein [Chloroflexi bacterium]|nr:metallophosphoesterase family protein [Chloroflexota bacterium]